MPPLERVPDGVSAAIAIDAPFIQSQSTPKKYSCYTSTTIAGIAGLAHNA
jgi:hypothetical protein